MKNRVLFSSKDKRTKSKCRLLQFLFGALRVILIQETNTFSPDSHNCNTQSRGRSFDPSLLSDETLNRGPFFV